MKIDRSKVKKSTSEVPAECKNIIDKLKACANNRGALLSVLQKIKTWTYGKCELFHWADVLDMFDAVLEASCKKEHSEQWLLPCDLPQEEKLKLVLLQVLQFTSLLIEHSFTRHLYNSMEHLTTLLSSSDMTVVLAVLNLLYVFSKRSNFITRLSGEKKLVLVERLTHLAESWGGKENGFGLAECCQDMPLDTFPASATTLHFEYYADKKDEKSGQKTQSVLSSIHVDSVDQIPQLSAQVMEDLMHQHAVPKEKQMLLLTHIRLAQAFSTYDKRIQCVQARLQAISVLVYSNAIQDNVNSILYTGFIEELVDVLQVPHEKLMEIKAAALRTLTSIIHLDRNPKLQNIIDATGASSYHGFLPILVRNCIEKMTDAKLEPYPQSFATALFSFLYHLASYECGGEALVSCGMMESLLKVINWLSEGQDHITFVTRAVRVVDLITNLGMSSFQTHQGLNAFINRLQHEVDVCRREQPYVIRVPNTSNQDTSGGEQNMEGIPPSSPTIHHDPDNNPVPMETDASAGSSPSTSGQTAPLPAPAFVGPAKKIGGKVPVCFPQRAALLKSMLNFLKKAIPDPAFAESIRHLMDGFLPRSLKHIISNAEYYGPSLFLLGTDVVTVYVFQEPSLLSSLQDNGLTDVVLHALLVKDVPPTREVLGALPNVFSALCLNARGLESFVQCKPFDRLFKVLLSPDYLPAMRRRRSSDPPGDTASSLGSSMDELMRHQPSLRTEATKSIILLLEEVCLMGRDSKYTCQKPLPKNEQAAANLALRNQMANDGGSSEDEDEEDDEAKIPATASASDVTALVPADAANATATVSAAPTASTSTTPEQQEKTAIPLMDYVLNVMKFVEAILSNNTTDDHCREFVTQNGLTPLIGILGLPNLPIDFPASQSCQAVASVCKHIMTLSHEADILQQGLVHLNNVLESLEPLHEFLPSPGGSVLLHELANAPGTDPITSAQATPLLHALAAAHAYVAMFTHVCKVGQTEMRNMSINHWGSALGLKILAGLSRLYTTLVWESSILLAFCNDDVIPQGSEFGKADLEKLLPKDLKSGKSDSSEQLASASSSKELGTNGVSHAMETLTTSDRNSSSASAAAAAGSPMDTVEASTSSTSTISSTSSKKCKLSPRLQAQMKQIKPLLSASSRLGRILTELFALLVKLCVGSPVRTRRTQIVPVPAAPNANARAVAGAIAKLVSSGLTWQPPAYAPSPRLRLTYFICSVGFTSPMLFDDRKQPFHLMLHKFRLCGGHDALFEAFRWALAQGQQAPNDDGLDALPDSAGEFLDSWLVLLEKLVNVKNVTDSVHTLPAKSTLPGQRAFSVVQYLIHTHKMAFESVMYLWNKKPLKGYGSRMTDSILNILSHIIKGEPIIKEKVEKEREEARKEKESASSAAADPSSDPSSSSFIATFEPTRSAAAPAAAPAPAPVNAGHMEQLEEMGFSREHAMLALAQTTSLEAATEWCLSNPPPDPPAPAPEEPPAAPAVEPPAAADADPATAGTSQAGEGVSSSTTEAGTSKEEAKKEEPTPPVIEDEPELPEEEPLSPQVLDEFCERVVSGCMCLLDALPESVYRVCDLLSDVATRNGPHWRNEVLLTSLVAEIAELSICLIEETTKCQPATDECLDKFVNKEESNKLATRLHLLSLLFEEMRMPCAENVEDSGILTVLVKLLDHTQRWLCTSNKRPDTPKWIAPLLLLLDLYEKISVASRRKAELNKVIGKKHVWKWFDDRTGKWCGYSTSNNKSIDDSYHAGEQNVRFSAGRRRYTVHFHNMLQINEETGNRRPIMLSLPDREEEDSSSTSNRSSTRAIDGSSNSRDIDESHMDTDTGADGARIMNGINPDHAAIIIKCSVGLLSVPVVPDALHALLRVVLRLTREHQCAMQFAELNGISALLSLTHDSGFQGFTSIATLILRHILEEPATLKHTMEKVLRSATAGTGSSSSGVIQNSIGSKEIHYVLRVLGPAACREPEIFTNVITQSLRIALPPPAKRDEEEARLTLSTTPQLVKVVMSKNNANQPASVTGCVKKVVEQLLAALILKSSKPPTQQQPQIDKDTINSLTAHADVIDALILLQSAPAATPTAATPTAATPTAATPPAAAAMDVSTDSNGGENAAAKKPEGEGSGTATPKVEKEKPKARPLLPKSAILRLLAELVRSFSGVAQLIAQHNYTDPSEETACITEDMNALAFILDWLLPHMTSADSCATEVTDKDCSALSRVLIATLAAANHCPEAQAILVTEIKAALQRATAMPESAEKHARLQALTSIMSTIIEACPSPANIPNQPNKQAFKGQQQLPVNNMVKLLLKKTLVTDLARITYSLDLSSPNMAATVNSALKPLETLSRIVNQPQGSLLTGRGSGKAHGGGSRLPGGTATTVAEMINATGSNNVGDEDDDEDEATHPLVTEATEQQNTENTQREEAGESTRPAGADITIEDVSGQDHEGLEEAHPISAIEPQSAAAAAAAAEAEADMEEMMDALLNGPPSHQRQSSTGQGGGAGEEEIIMESLEEPPTHDILDAMNAMMGGDPQHDSHMITQELSDEDDDDEDNTQDEDDERDEEEVDEGEDDVDDEDEDDDDIEEDEGSEMDGDDEEEEEDYHPMNGIDAAFHQMASDAADDLYVQLEEMMPSGAGGGMFSSDPPGGMSRILEARSHYTMPQLFNDMNDTDFLGSSNVPPAPSTVTASHPLLVRHADAHALGGAASGLAAARVHRSTSRARNSYRYNPATQTLHLQYTPNVPASASGSGTGGGGGTRGLSAANNLQPALLQRLLGPGGASDLFHLTNPMAGGGGGRPRFHFISSDSNVRLLNPTPDHNDTTAFDDFLLQESAMLDGENGASSVLASVPSALARWSEEARVLDGDTMHDCITVLKPQIIGELEKYRDIELAERKEKRKKQAKEEEANKPSTTTSAPATTTITSATAAAVAAAVASATVAGSMIAAAPQAVQAPVSTSVIQVRSSAAAGSAAEAAAAERSRVMSSSMAATIASMANYADALASGIVSSPMLTTPSSTPAAAASSAAAAVSTAAATSSAAQGGPPQTPIYVPSPSPMVFGPGSSTERMYQAPTSAQSLLHPQQTPAQDTSSGAFSLLATPQTYTSRPGVPPNAPMRPGLAYSNYSPSVQQQTPLPAFQTSSSASSSSAAADSTPLSNLMQPAFLNLGSSRTAAAVQGQYQQQQQPGGAAAQQISAMDISNIVNSIPLPATTTQAGAGGGSSGGGGGQTVQAPTVDAQQAIPAVTSSATAASTTTSSSTAAPAAAAGSSSSAAATAGGPSSSSSTAPTSSSSGSGGGGGGGVSSSRGLSTMFGDISLPDGVDPAFLAALPDDVRQEVVAEQLRLQRIQQQQQEQQAQAQQLGVGEVSQEFLNALPPSIQEEVLAQQRAEQARLAQEQQQQSAAAAAPAAHIDEGPGSIISSLPPGLRQQVLADMDDSVVAVLPPEMAVEANMLRRELQERHQRIMHERLYTQHESNPLTALLRSSGLASRLVGSRYMRPPQPRRHWSLNRGGASGGAASGSAAAAAAVKLRGRHLLDHEALTCLLVLLFVDEPRLNTSRLHRVLRNLCYHPATRQWIIRALLSILQKTGNVQCKPPGTQSPASSSASASAASASPYCDSGEIGRPQSAWLSISLDAALGCRTNVFQMQRSASSVPPGTPHTGKKSSSQPPPPPACVSIHPQAAPIVCRHVLDTLISLAKSFPSHFLPQHAPPPPSSKALCIEDTPDSNKTKDSSLLKTPGTTPASSGATTSRDLDFWELLVRLDGSVAAAAGSKKGKSFQKQQQQQPVDSASTGADSTGGTVSFDASPLGQLMSMLAHPVVRRSQQLTDRLLRLLGLVSIGLSTQSSSQATAAASTSSSTPQVLQIAQPSSTAASAPATPSQPAVTVSAGSASQRVTAAPDCQQASSTAATPATPAGPAAAAASSSATPAPAATGDDTLGLSETMDMSSVPDDQLTSTPMPGKAGESSSLSEKKASSASGAGEPASETSAVLEAQLQLAVNVLTSKSCSEEGLEDATSLLVQLSRANSATRDTVLKLMLAGATTIGLTVQAHISQLLGELTALSIAYDKENPQAPKKEGDDDNDAFPSPSSQAQKGMLYDRFAGGHVIVHAPSKVKHGAGGGRELQLPSMAQLTSKMSSQHFLLRILKVIIQLREAAKAAAAAERAAKLREKQSRSAAAAGAERNFAPTSSAVAESLSAIAHALDMVNHTSQPSSSSSSAPATGPAAGPPYRSIQAAAPGQLMPRPLSEIMAARNAPQTAAAAASSSSGQQPQQQQPEQQQVTLMDVDPQPASSSSSSSSSTPAPTSAAAPSAPAPAAANATAGDAAAAVALAAAVLADADEEDQEADKTMVDEEEEEEEEDEFSLPRLSEQLQLDELWSTLGQCLTSLANTTDHHAVLVLQPAVEAFFMVHAGEKVEKSSQRGSQRGGSQSGAGGAARDDMDHLDMQPMSPAQIPASSSNMSLTRQDSLMSTLGGPKEPQLPPDTEKFLKFAETHRTVLNQILRQSTTQLADGPFSVLVDHTRILDFDVKRRYFRHELERIDEGGRREDLAVHVRREHVFEDSFRDIHRRSTDEWKHRFYIVFEGEEGQDAGGLLREWYLIMSREIFNPNYALFMISPGDRVTYTINPSSHCNSNHLSYFKFVGRFLAKAVYDNKLLECYFTRSFYKHILSKAVHYTDMETEDYSFHQGLIFLLNHNVKDLGYDLTFSLEMQEFGKTEVRELKPGGRNLHVTDENKKEYIKLVCIEKMTGAIKQQLRAFLEGFYDIIPMRLISIFNEQELELLISGLPTVDIDDLKANTEYHKYQTTSLQIQWFWRALRSFEQADRAAFLQFVTGTSKVPLQGFAYLEGMNGIQKFQIHRDDRSTDRLPCAHTCFNQLDLPAYETYDKLRKQMMTAIHECSEGFGLA